MPEQKLEIKLEGKTLIFETGKIAKQANGSVVLHCGETTLLSTCCSSKKPSEEIDFLPLTVIYQEKFSSVGKTVSGFIKREGRPTQKEILTSRFIDRSLRPLFEEGYYNEIQVLSYVYSYDGLHVPDVLAICASSAACVLSDVPLKKPVGAVRVGLLGDLFVINPNPEEQKESTLDLILSGTEDGILMIEGYSDFLDEKTILEAIEYGHNAIKQICIELKKWQEKIGKEKNKKVLYIPPENILEYIENLSKDSIEKALKIKDKKERGDCISSIKENIEKTLLEKYEEFTSRDISLAFKKYLSSIMRDMVLKDKKRIDGRSFDEIRKIDIELASLIRTHGNALFTRGETQTIAVCTLGNETMAQRYEDLHGDSTHRFYFQYFFPPFSVGEARRIGPPGRREIGHGKLAERALLATLPEREQFPYVIRLESNITECNGSSSMASVCGGCLALMDAGVPIKRPVSGIAMGLILENEEFVILSDIIGDEDALGDMDLKITGDKEGITAFQMDIKVEGITKEIMEKALMQAKKGRSHILEEMLKICPKSNPDISIHAPRILTMQIPQSKIGMVIGPGGKQIKAIIEEAQVEMDISNDGLITVTSKSKENISKAKQMILNITKEPEIGKVYEGTIVTIKPFGLFVKIFSKEGFCHISEISHSRIQDITKIFKIGDVLEVKVMDVNDRGQISLSHKILLKKNQE